MDSGVETTQRIVITGAIVLAIAIVFLIGYSLYVKANRAETELANKIELDNQTAKQTDSASISLTGESKNSSNFPYDGLVQKDKEVATTTDFGVVNEVASDTTYQDVEPIEEPIPEEPVEPATPAPKVVKKTTTSYNGDRPLTLEEIRAIRQLPVDDSPSGNLQTSLEEQSNGQYKARY